MDRQETVWDPRQLLAKGDEAAFRRFCEANHPEQVAEYLIDFEAEDIWTIIRHAPLDLRAEIFTRLEDDQRLDVAELMTRGELAALLSEMAPDNRADLFRDLPEERHAGILAAMAQAEREDIRKLASFREGTTGAIMTSDYATLLPDLTASEALGRLRIEAPNKETIYYAYVIDAQRRLTGFVSLKDLILAHPGQKVRELMHEDPLFARVDDDQETAARKLQKFDLLALPVLDAHDVLVGIITHDDAFDVIIQEQTEDLEKIMAIGGRHEAVMYMRTSAWQHFKNRGVWVVSLAALGLVSGLVIHHFEDVLTNLLILALYMPMLADAGGNTGSQAATMIVRALALNEVKPRDVFRILFKELKVSLMMALVLGALAWGRVMFLSRGVELPGTFTLPMIGMTIAVALSIQVVSATLIGALLPLGAAKLKLDPAVVASPALTTMVDITGLLIYFSTARLLLGL